MKTIKFIIWLLLTANIAVFASPKSNDEDILLNDNVVLIENIEALANGETRCFSGGENANSCSIGGGIELDVGVSFACSISCDKGSYACCHVGCRCIQYPDETID